MEKAPACTARRFEQHIVEKKTAAAVVMERRARKTRMEIDSYPQPGGVEYAVRKIIFQHCAGKGSATGCRFRQVVVELVLPLSYELCAIMHWLLASLTDFQPYAKGLVTVVKPVTSENASQLHSKVSITMAQKVNAQIRICPLAC